MWKFSGSDTIDEHVRLSSTKHTVLHASALSHCCSSSSFTLGATPWYHTPSPLQALKEDRLSRSDLSWIHPYQPSLGCSWLFQRSMSVGVGQLATVPSPEGPGPGAVRISPPPPLDHHRHPRRSGLLPPSHVNDVLAANFSVMRVLGDRVLRPFLQVWGMRMTWIGLKLSPETLCQHDSMTFDNIILKATSKPFLTLGRTPSSLFH